MNMKPLLKMGLGSLALAGLVACGGGGGGMPSGMSVTTGTQPVTRTTTTSDGAPSNIRAIRALSSAEVPAERPEAQDSRSAGIVNMIDSLDVSTLHYYITNPSFGGSFSVSADCSGTVCTLTEPQTGVQVTVDVLDETGERGWTSFSSIEELGTRNGITSIRVDGRQIYPGLGSADFRMLGSWMEHSGFMAADMGLFYPAGTIPGVRIDVRMKARGSFAGGDLTGTRPTGDATWRGIMTGTPATGPRAGNRLTGDASLAYDFDTSRMAAEFTRIIDTDRIASHSVTRVGFTDIAVRSDGEFGGSSGTSRIEGGIYGPGHGEVAGVFEASNILGAFGAKQ